MGMSDLPFKVQSRRRLSGARLALESRRLRAKWTARALRRAQQVLTLEPPTGVATRGQALVSYVLDGVRQARAGRLDHSHTHFWEAYRVARTFADLGFQVDVVHWQNSSFVPTKPYRAVVDVRSNLERWAPALGDGCLKIFHGETAHWRFHQEAQAERYRRLHQRRGVLLDPVKPAEPNRGIEAADVGFILGNDFTLSTYAFAGTPLESLALSANTSYPNLERAPEARRRFLWFGSADLVHKGLDLVLEVVARRPHLELVVCGPIHREPAFERLYRKELYGLPNIHTYGWIDTQSEDFLRIARFCSAMIYPSCSEGQCGGVITCMHAGLVPIVTAQCGITIEPEFGVQLPDDRLESIASAMEAHANASSDSIAGRSTEAAEHVRVRHTREVFASRYRSLVERLIGDAR